MSDYIDLDQLLAEQGIDLSGYRKIFFILKNLSRKAYEKACKKAFVRATIIHLNLIWNMKKNKVSDKDIAKFINVDIVKKITNKKQVDIPLHLLDQGI